jgi:hypothetical protein
MIKFSMNSRILHLILEVEWFLNDTSCELQNKYDNQNPLFYYTQNSKLCIIHRF